MLIALIRGINKISDVMGFVGGVLICVIACLLMYDVFMRFGLNRPVDWVLDVTTLLQAAIAFLVGGYVLKIGGHVNMAALVNAASPKWSRRLRIFTTLVTGLCSACMAVLSWSLFTKSLAINEKAFGIDLAIAPWKFLVPLGFTIMALQGIAMSLGLWLFPDQFSQEEGGH